MPSLLQSSQEYRALIQRLNNASPGYQGLHHYVNIKPDTVGIDTEFTLLTIILEESPTPEKPCVTSREFQGIAKLADEIASSQTREGSCNIFLVENVCPQTIALLGGYFDINPQFFADHVKNGDWFKDHSLMDQIPALPSSQKWHDFLQVRFIQTITVSSNSSSNVKRLNGSEGVGVDTASQDPLQDYLVPDESITRLPRKAGKLIPRARDDEFASLELLLCTKQCITVWFGKKATGDQGWNAIILIDAPFQLPPGRSFCRLPVYRSFMRRPTLADPAGSDLGLFSTNRQALIRHFKGCLLTKDARNIARADSFFMLGGLYQLSASNWMVINEYVNREITSIEYKLEREEPSFRDLEICLKDLYLHRRRITRYSEIISETKAQVGRKGPRAWPREPSSELAADQARDWEDDFTNLHIWFNATSSRIEKDIRLLTALVAIGEGKQGLIESHGIGRLSLLTMVFLPFSSVAAILGMQGNFAPGDGKFWLFWVLGISLTTIVVGMFLLYDRFVAWVKEYLQRMQKRKSTAKRNRDRNEDERSPM